MKRSARPKRKSPRLEGFDYDEPRCYFVTICTVRRRAVFAEARLNRAVLALMANHAHGEGVILHAYSLMPDHLHLLVELPDVGLSRSKWVGRLKGLVSTTAREMGFRGRLWQGRFYDHILRKEECIERVADYIVHNPVRKGLVETWIEHPWSGLGGGDVKM